MTRPVAVALGIVVALAGTAALDVVVTGSPSVVPLGALCAAVALVVGSKWLGANVLSRPAGSRPGELGDPDDDLLDVLLDGVLDGADGGDGLMSAGDASAGQTSAGQASTGQASATPTRPEGEEGSGG